MSIPLFEIGPVDQNIVYSFAAGFIIAWLIFGIRILVVKSRLRRENRELRSSVMQRMEMDSGTMERMKKELEDLRKRNENLKITAHKLSEKPGRKEKFQLQIYQTAIEKMSVGAPGFAPAWHVVLKECEQEAGRSLDGTVPFVRKLIPGAGSGWAQTAGADGAEKAGSEGTEPIKADSELSGKSAGASGRGLLSGLFGKGRDRD